MNKTIWFDMDGTLADLYGYDNWLPLIRSGSTEPYANAKPLVHMPTFARKCNELRKCGYNIGVISWTSKTGSEEYSKAVAYAKVEWLEKHMPSVIFDSIIVCDYGTPKSMFANNGDILFDDEIENRIEWEENVTMTAYDNTDIIKRLCKITTTP